MKPMRGQKSLRKNLVGDLGPHLQTELPAPEIVPQFGCVRTPAAPLVSLSSSSLTFSAQAVGTRSRAQTVRLTNTGKGSLTISSIVASGDFSQTNTCGATLNAGASCAIPLTFKPLGLATRRGALSISDNTAGSPRRVALTGTGRVITAAPGAGGEPARLGRIAGRQN